MGLSKDLVLALENKLISAPDREKLISKSLHFRPELAESRIQDASPDIYSGVRESALSTPFFDYYQLLKDLGSNEVVADLGAGHCKGTLLSEAIGMHDKCLSYEISQERLEGAWSTARRLGLSARNMKACDLRKDKIPFANCYFVYLPLGELIYRPIQALLREKRKARFYVVESHGDLIDFFNAMPKWFTLERVLPSEGQRHRGGIHVYSFLPRDVDAHELNSSEFIYPFVSNFSVKRRVRIRKESGPESVLMKDLLPFYYNGQMCFECLSLKRFVDYQNVVILGL